MPTINSSDDVLRECTPVLNAGTIISQIVEGTTTPIARLVGDADIPNPPAPAWYVPGTSDIYIHVDRAGIDRKDLPTNAYDLCPSTLGAAKTLGLLAHEAAHAAISNDNTAMWANARHQALLTMLEEVRVENYAVRRSPLMRSNLRASFTLILAGISDGLELADTAAVAHAWGLVHGRTLAGVATTAETKPLDTAARTLLGDDVVDTLTDLLQEVLTLALPHQTKRLLEICDEWVELVGESSADERCAGGHDGTGAKGSGTPGAGSAPGAPDGGERSEGGAATDDKPKSMVADGDPTEEDGTLELDPEATGSGLGTPGVAAVDHGDPTEGTPRPIDPEGKELAEDLIKDLTADMHKSWQDPDPAGQRANSAEWAARVFGNTKTYQRLTPLEPTMKNRQDIVKVAGVLSNLSLPAIAKVSRPMVVPPGRLRSRETVRASAERAQGQMVSARPWKGTVRRHANARPLIVGIATDTSGSMSWAADAVADFAYVYANAGHRIGARTAAVTFGSRVYRIARPGEVMTHVVHKLANDGEETCDYALAALDGVLHLTQPSYAARVLLVVSDGRLVRSGESAKVTEWLKAMSTVGTHVLWITDHHPGARYWLTRLERKLTNLTVIAARDGSIPGGEMTFDELSTAALTAITRYIR